MFYKSCIMHTCQSLWRLWHMCHAHYPKAIHNYRQIPDGLSIDHVFHVLIHSPPRVWGFILPTGHSARGPARSHGEGSRSGRSRVFTTCQVRVFNFYHLPPPPHPPPPPPPPHPRAPELSGHCRPQPRAPELSGHCLTSTASAERHTPARIATKDAR